jgi:hypothetical protein
LKAVSNKKLQVDYLLGDSIAKTQIIKGSVKDKHFVMGKKTKIRGWLPFVFWGYMEYRAAIGLSKEGYLKVRSGTYGTGQFLIFLSNRDMYNTDFYRNLDNKSIMDKVRLFSDSLAGENPDKPIFYLTQTNSIQSYVWYHEPDSLRLYSFTPNGVEKAGIADKRKVSIPDVLRMETLSKFPFASMEEDIVGCARYSDDKFKRQGICVDLHKFMGQQGAADNSYESIVRNDMSLIGMEYEWQRWFRSRSF